jgi:hypothetical protein
MSVESYLKGCKRGLFTWECVESGEYGFGAVDTEHARLEGRICAIYRLSSNEFQAEVDNLKINAYEYKEFASRLSARKWCERIVLKDIEMSKSNG